MIFAEMQYDEHYSEIHDSLVEFLMFNFSKVEHGHQGDSWIWIFDGEEKVAIDTFSSMKHELKCGSPNSVFAQKVVEVLSTKYQLAVHSEPEIEPHEDI